MKVSTAALLWQIADCPHLRRCRTEPDPSHPCQAIVSLQADCPVNEHQRPEPWNGHIESAPILFVSSNPSIDRSEPYPTLDAGTWPREKVEAFFERRFDDHIVEGNRPVKLNGLPAGRPVRYLNEVKNIATALLGRHAEPGIDYSLTEVVHCKSARRAGLERRRGRPGALALCPSLYLRQVVEASGAVLVVAAGRDARQQLRRELSLPAEFGVLAKGGVPLVGPMEIGAGPKHFLALGGIGSAERRNPEDDRVLTSDQREAVLAFLRRSQRPPVSQTTTVEGVHVT